MMRLEAYERKMAWIQVLLRGFSPIGSKVCVQRKPLKNCAVTPKTNENNIQPQFMPWANVSEMRWKSNSRYIHHKIANPKRIGKAMFRVRFIFLFSVNSVPKIWWYCVFTLFLQCRFALSRRKSGAKICFLFEIEINSHREIINFSRWKHGNTQKKKNSIIETIC